MSSNKMLCNGLAPLLLARILRTSPTNIKTTKPTTPFIERHWCTKRTTFVLSDTGIETKAGEVSKSSLHSSQTLTVQQPPTRVTTDHILVSMDLTVQSPMPSNNMLESTQAVTTQQPCTTDIKIQVLSTEVMIPDDQDSLKSESEEDIGTTSLVCVPREQCLPSAILDILPCKGSMQHFNMLEPDARGWAAEESFENSTKCTKGCVEYHCGSYEKQNLMMENSMYNEPFSEDGCCFPRFPDFPTEVQCLIWDFSMEEDRIIEVHITKRCVKWMIVYASTDTKNPAILSVCRVAREQGLKQYKVLSVENSWGRDKEMYDERQQLLGLPSDFVGPGAATTNFKRYVNYGRDTVFINSSHFRIYSDALEVGDNTWREAFGYQFLKDLFFSPGGDQIQKLAVDYLLAENWFDNGRNHWQYCQVLAAMPQLQKLDIVWTGHHSLQRVIRNECCRTRQIEILPDEILTDEERYGVKFTPDGLHHRVFKFHEMEGLGSYLGEGWISERFASGETSTTWKSNIMTAIQQNRPVNPANYSPNSFHFIAGGKSRYRDLDDLEFTEVAVERE
ncbi:hypothetical protein EAF04_002052 [Stromatinia cepivora]|nr:hypothetical protein EAF04_002052 [Stromatinia cepivora]